MKKIFYILLSVLCLSSCFEDKGNYDYEFLNPPIWLINTSATPIYIWCRVGEDAVFKGSDKLTWGEDSIARKNSVRYEWIFKNVNDEEVVVGEGMDLVLPTQDVLEKLGYQEIPTKTLWGHFAVIDKQTEVRWLAKAFLNISSAYAAWDWFVLSENGTKAKLSAIRRNPMIENGQQVVKWDLQDNVYEKINGHEIPGKPLDLVFSRAKNIGTQGASTVITEQVAFEINNEYMTKVGEIKDQFLDGTPASFDMVARRDIDPISESQSPFTFVATKDGKIYSRKMSKNWLGGEFLTEPYYIDSKGYKITSFGHSRYGGAFPCYDELNGRIIMACTYTDQVGSQENPVSAQKMKMVPLTQAAGQGGVPVWGLPIGTKVLHISENQHFRGMRPDDRKYSIVFENQGRYLMGDFVVNGKSFQLENDFNAQYRYFNIPGPVNSDSKFLLSANGRGVKATTRDLFSSGNKIYYLPRDVYNIIDTPDQAKELFVEISSKITFMTYDWDDCNLLVVGCEDGNIYGYEISTIEAPKLQFKLNVGGKVISTKQLGFGSMTYNHDYY